MHDSNAIKYTNKTLNFGITLSKFNESAQKIKQIEEKQIQHLQNQIKSKNEEKSRLENDIEQYQSLKEEKKSKLYNLNKAMINSFVKLKENFLISEDDSENTSNNPYSIYQENLRLYEQLSVYLNSDEELIQLQKLADSLETELFELTEKRAISNAVVSPFYPKSDLIKNKIRINCDLENVEDLQQLKENKDLLKKQINEMETFIRNGIKYERDEAKSKIKKLKRNVSVLSNELHKLKDEETNLQNSKLLNNIDSSTTSTDSLSSLKALCDELESIVLSKESEVSQLILDNQSLKADHSQLKTNILLIEKELSAISNSIMYPHS